mgnify:CR=1 FL=1
MSENLWLLAGMGVLVAFGSALLWLTTKMAKRLELALERSERRAEENRARALVPPQDALVRSLRRLEIMRGVWAERDRQDAKFGPQHHHWPRWIAIMGEEFGEVGGKFRGLGHLRRKEVGKGMGGSRTWPRRAATSMGPRNN